MVKKISRKLSLKLKLYNMITIDELKKKQTTKTRLIGLDLGSKRIGVAISDENQKIATPFKTLQNNGLKNLISDLLVIIDENKIGGIIIGNPINMDGSFGKASQSVTDISKNISKSVNINVSLWDERLSTVGAFNLSSQLDINVSKREKKIDQNAAAFILQGALDFLNN
jgi:putative Holliday junction resolvase